MLNKNENNEKELLAEVENKTSDAETNNDPMAVNKSVSEAGKKAEEKLPIDAELKKRKDKKRKIKLIAILSIEFIAVFAVLALIFFAGKKSHTVTFDLNGGILISGDTVQRVTQGQNATPPQVAKFGHYLLGWSGSYKSITRDVVLKAIWEFETSPGIEYYIPENTNYCEVSGSHKYIQGEVYIGAFHDDRKVLGIQAEAFKDRDGITAVYLLDGILSIEKEAFAGCDNLEMINIPSTCVEIGEEAFKDCVNLKEIILPESMKRINKNAFKGCTSLEKVICGDQLIYIGEGAFSGCSALGEVDLGESVRQIEFGAFSACEALREVVIPKSLISVAKEAFDTPDMTIYFCFSEEELPITYIDGWCPENTTFVFDFVPEPEEEEGENGENGKDDEDGDSENASKDIRR